MADERDDMARESAVEGRDTAEVVHHPAVRWPMLAASSTAAGIALLDERYRFLWANEGFCALLDWPVAELVGQSGTRLVQRQALQPAWLTSEARAGAWQRVQIGDSEAQGTRDALMSEMYLPARRDGAAVLWTVIDPRDELSQSSFGTSPRFHDPLDEMASVWLFEDRLQHALERADRLEQGVGLLLARLDNREALREHLGEAGLDGLQQQVGRRLVQTLRSEDSLTRLGQSHWGILIEHPVSPERLQMVVLRCQEAMEAPFRVEHATPLLTLSCGIAIYPHDGSTLELLLESAEAALLRAAPASHAFYDPSLRALLAQRLAFQEFMQDALLRPAHYFRVVYQPRLDPHSGQCRELEAQLRLLHPERGELLPQDFLPVVADMGQAVWLDRWIIEQLVTQHEAWQASDSALATLGVALDIDAATLDQSLTDRRPLDAMLRGLSTDLGWLSLELEEHAFILQAAEHAHLLRRLTALGVRLAVSHVGQGAVDVVRLAGLPVSRVTFGPDIAAALRQHGSPATRGFEALARCLESLGLEGVVTGVSTTTQRDVAGCLARGLIQGDGVCSALEAEALADWLNGRA